MKNLMSHNTTAAGGGGEGRRNYTLRISTFISLRALCCNSRTGILMPTMELYGNLSKYLKACNITLYIGHYQRYTVFNYFLLNLHYSTCSMCFKKPKLGPVIANNMHSNGSHLNSPLFWCILAI
jgi:hypothetical protein